ncbi:MAG: radical SAM protein [Methanocellales archaeon]
MAKVKRDSTDSFYTAQTRGCELCAQGAKLVLFITGLCSRHCFYCPLSDKRRGVDRVFANERPVTREEDVIEEALNMSALGTGITGGEPLLKLERVLHYILLLKQKFGDEHHLHLYTSLPVKAAELEALSSAGLDEIRFHPPEEHWDSLESSDYYESLKIARKLGLDIAIEIPAIRAAKGIIKALKKTSGYLILNELEFSETNEEELKARGFVYRDDVSYAAKGSREVAWEILKQREGVPVRFCSSRFKDAVQMRERLKRIASNVARPFDEITEEGTIIYGVISSSLEAAVKILLDLKVPRDMYQVMEDHIEIAWWILDEIGSKIKLNCELYILERYPTKNGLVVEKIPL